MIYSKIIDSNSVINLQADLEKFLHVFNTQPNESKRIIKILQSESFAAWASTHRGFETDNKKWHGTITIIYEAKHKIVEKN